MNVCVAMDGTGLVDPIDLGNLLNENCLTFLHLNIRSILNKTKDLEILLSSTRISFDVIILTEAWYNNHSPYFVLPNYKPFVLNRTNKTGGGVSIQITPDLEVSLINDYFHMTSDFEVITALNGKKYFFGSLPSP